MMAKTLRKRLKGRRNSALVFLIFAFFTVKTVCAENKTIAALALSQKFLSEDIVHNAIVDSDLVVKGTLSWMALRDGYMGHIKVEKVLKGGIDESVIPFYADPGLSLGQNELGIWFLKKSSQQGYHLNTTCPGLSISEEEQVEHLIAFPQVPSKLVQLDINKTVDIRISMKESSSDRFPLIRLDFVGNDEAKKFAEDKHPFGVGRIAIEPSVMAASRDDSMLWGAFLIELVAPSGQLVPFDNPNESIRFKLPEMTGTAVRVYEQIGFGVFYSLDLPIGQWFDLRESGLYHLKVHYSIYEASSKWGGPVTSNELMFAVKVK